MILALGRIGGEEARAALAEIEPRSDSETEALRKARDRVSGPATGFAWREVKNVFASVPIGLEDVAIAEAGEATFVRKGMIALAARPAGLRCIYDVRMLIAEGKARAFAETVRMAKVSWREWISSASDSLPYRFSLENVRITKQEFNDLLRLARETFAPQGLVDSPSSYAAMLRVEADDDATRIWLVPTFEPDVRFAYRVADVGASINPVVGACLARLVRRGDKGVAVDPTCGSGTLLIERALLDGGTVLGGDRHQSHGHSGGNGERDCRRTCRADRRSGRRRRRFGGVAGSMSRRFWPIFLRHANRGSQSRWSVPPHRRQHRAHTCPGRTRAALHGACEDARRTAAAHDEAESDRGASRRKRRLAGRRVLLERR